MTLLVRRATHQDYDDLCLLYEELDTIHREQLPDRFQRPQGPTRDREFLMGRIGNPNVLFLVAEAGQDMCGFVQASMMDTPVIPTLKPRHYAYINEIIVRADYRHQGIGKQLMAAAEGWAIARGASSVELGTYEFNTDAHAFYQQLGYATLHRRMNKALPAQWTVD